MRLPQEGWNITAPFFSFDLTPNEAGILAFLHYLLLWDRVFYEYRALSECFEHNQYKC